MRKISTFTIYFNDFDVIRCHKRIIMAVCSFIRLLDTHRLRGTQSFNCDIYETFWLRKCQIEYVLDMGLPVCIA